MEAGSDDHMLQRIQEQRKAIDNMRLQIAGLRGALLAVAEWRLPHPGFGWVNGSNGERDHFRDVARHALNTAYD